MIWKRYHSKSVSEEYLYKFLSEENFKHFLKTGSIWFSRADLFGDKMECVLLTDLLEAELNGKVDFEKILNRQKRYLISCWHLANRETLVLWDTYSKEIGNRRTIAIRFKRDILLRLLHKYEVRNAYGGTFFHTTKYIHGKIQYKDLIGKSNDELVQTTMKYPSFRKEYAFNYENEYRFVIQLGSSYSYPENGYNYPLHEVSQLPFDIIFNPQLPAEYFHQIKEYIVSKGLGHKLKESELKSWLQPELR